jgi:effector-binding domain-containing protein
MAYEIELRELPARPVATIRVATTPNRMGETFAESLPAVLRYLESQGVEPAGPGFGIFYQYDSDHVDMDIGFPVSRAVEGNERVAGRTLDSATFAITWHIGSYRTIGEAHRAIEAWVQEQGRKVTGPPWEVYWDGPESGVEPSAFRTEVGYPVA